MNRGTQNPTPEEIAARAYSYYDQEGRAEGRSTEHWLRAERELREERQQGTKKSEAISQPQSGSKPGNRGRKAGTMEASLN